ncbi:Hypothetical_protein [Hexamita inflata]|uniref:Hypothetical_protein n=1 Tax=Hexamita inflata TaxID=28002 RepID=A0AA86RH81_9EUKA|nr:Hypothetical protein HINF_LOCUS65480 [Hexamita inflata]CAI9977843.1 Hypothetical protein HINF_LOCUS65488 [Hexamita inflata]
MPARVTLYAFVTANKQLLYQYYLYPASEIFQCTRSSKPSQLVARASKQTIQNTSLDGAELPLLYQSTPAAAFLSSTAAVLTIQSLKQLLHLKNYTSAYFYGQAHLLSHLLCYFGIQMLYQQLQSSRGYMNQQKQVEIMLILTTHMTKAWRATTALQLAGISSIQKYITMMSSKVQSALTF